MQNITVDELREKLASLRACTAISFESETIPKLLKKHRVTKEPCPYETGDISKVNIMAGLIGLSYSNSVNNQLGREDKELDFTAQSRKWGDLMENRVLVCKFDEETKEDKFYLQVVVKSYETPRYLWGNTEIPVKELEGYLPIERPPKTQAELEKKVVIKNVSLENIRWIRMLGEEYIITEHEVVEAVRVETVPEVEEVEEEVREDLELLT